jgi:hypothetical protein
MTTDGSSRSVWEAAKFEEARLRVLALVADESRAEKLIQRALGESAVLNETPVEALERLVREIAVGGEL